MVGELLHYRFFTMDKERRLASPDAAAPCEQLPLVGVSGKSVDRMNRAADWNLFTEEPHMLGAIDDLPCNRTRGSKTNEDDRGFSAPQIVSQMVTDPASRTHARTRHDDSAASYSVNGNRIGRVACEMQIRYAEWVAAFAKQTRDRRIEAFAMAREDLGCRDCHRRIEEDLHGGRQLATLHTLVQDVENFLSALERGSGNDDVAAPREAPQMAS